MKESTVRTIRKFNPGMLQSDSEVIDQFVVRELELNTVLEVLRGNVNSESCQHLLVVAPRGRGKTMLLARVAAELRTDSHLSEYFLPIRVMEESHEIADLADLWLETLFQLASEVTAHNPVLGQELRATHSSLTVRWREQALADYARAALLEAADRLDKQLVLMVENLQAVCASQDEDFGWKLRQVLQSEPKITLLASATSRFKGLDDAEQPFFELFRTVELPPLATEECRRLWQAASGDDVSDREIRPLQILTGGSPRLIVMVAGFARHRSLSLLMEELAALIDEHSEYFRSHVQVLPKTERRVYLAVVDLWRPSKPAEIAARARRGIRLVSATLGRLIGRGAVIAEGSGRKRLYSATERLYCIYYKLRRERGEATVVRHLIQFMSVFYSESEMADLFDTLIDESLRSNAIRDGIETALGDMPEIRSAFIVQQIRTAKIVVLTANIESLHQEVKAASKEEDLGRYFEGIDKILALVRQSVASAEESEIASESIGLVAATMQLNVTEQHLRGDLRKLATIRHGLVERFGTSDLPEIQVIVAKALIDEGALQQEFGNSKEAIETLDEPIKRFGGNEAPEVQSQVARALIEKGTVLAGIGNTSEAISAWEEVGRRFGTGGQPAFRVQVARALIAVADLKRGIGDRRAALMAYDDVATLFPSAETPEIQAEVARAMVGKGSMHGRFGDPEAAIFVSNEVVERFVASDAVHVQVQVAEALVLKGEQLEILGDRDGARGAFDQVAERFAGSDKPDLLLKVAWVLTNKPISAGVLQSARVSLARFDQLVERIYDKRKVGELIAIRMPLLYKAQMQEALGNSEGEIAVLDEVIQRLGATDVPRDLTVVAEALVKKGELLVKLGHDEAALQACEDFARRFDAMTSKGRIHLRWRTARTRIRALLAQGRHLAVLDAFGTVYALFDPRDTVMIEGVTECVRELVAGGIDERAVRGILVGDREKSYALDPLVTALRLRTGEGVRAPQEVLEVASDISEYLEGMGPHASSR